MATIPYKSPHTAVWYHTGLPAVPIRWVLLKDPKAQFQPKALRVQIHRLNHPNFALVPLLAGNSKSLPWKFERI